MAVDEKLVMRLLDEVDSLKKEVKSLRDENAMLKKKVTSLENERAKKEKGSSLNDDDIKALITRAEKSLSKEDCETIKNAFMMLDQLNIAYKKQKDNLKILLKTFFGKTTEKKNKKSSGADKKEKKKGKNKGKNGPDKYPGAEKVHVAHGSLKHGDPCPDCDGKVYKQEPSRKIRLTGHTPIGAKIYEIEKFRCNLCCTVFEADLPENVSKEKYDEKSKTAIVLFKYGFGVPGYRLESLQQMLGVPLPDSTQWDISKTLGEEIFILNNPLHTFAAESDLFYNDDTGVKIMSLLKENAVSKPKRKGMFTSCIVAEKDGRKICLYFSGRNHAGENLSKILDKREKSKDPPIQMCDALSRNIPNIHKVIKANCLAHGRRKFIELENIFPEESKYVIDIIAEVYKHDAVAEKEKMSAEERLEYHKEMSEPYMDKLKKWFYWKLKNKEVEENSNLGKAIKYMQNHWEKLTAFLKEPGVPIDNNECERAIKKAILYRKNSMIYKNEEGARIGDLFMSLINTCALNEINPFDYLVALQKNHELLKANPENWMPWNYKNTLDNNQ